MRLHHKRKKADGVVEGAQPFRLPTLKCRRCRHEWHPKSNRRPVRCAKCKSPYWDREREMPIVQHEVPTMLDGTPTMMIPPDKEGV